MNVNSLIEESGEYIQERLMQTKKKLELVYSSSKDTQKRNSILETLKNVDRDFKKFKAGLFNIEDLRRYNIEIEELQDHRSAESSSYQNGYKILRNIQLVKLSPLCNNNEVNLIWSYLQFFDREYLGLLSEQNLRLDYGHAYQRDRYYTNFQDTLRVLTRYDELLQQMEKATSAGNRDYRERLISIQGKQYRDVIVQVGRFLHSMNNFLDDLFESEANGEKVLLEPEKIVNVSGGEATLDGLTARAALEDLHDFVSEFIDYLKIPEIKKIEEEE